MGKFIIKNINRALKRREHPTFVANVTPKENNEEKNINEMTTAEKIIMASSILANNDAPKVKRTKKDRGLIERTENSTIILTEDNKELLKD